jgi:hypothetical protein
MQLEHQRKPRGAFLILLGKGESMNDYKELVIRIKSVIKDLPWYIESYMPDVYFYNYVVTKHPEAIALSMDDVTNKYSLISENTKHVAAFTQLVNSVPASSLLALDIATLIDVKVLYSECLAKLNVNNLL